MPFKMAGMDIGLLTLLSDISCLSELNCCVNEFLNERVMFIILYFSIMLGIPAVVS